jgi:hypothetical protein
LPNVQIVPISTNPGRTPEIVINPVRDIPGVRRPAAAAGAEFPPPPVCTKQCTDQLAVMKSTCEQTSKEVGIAFGIGSVGAGIATGFMSRSPLVGMAVFKWTGAIGASNTAATGCLHGPEHHVQ